MYHLLDMEKSLDVHMYECKECSYTTTYEHYFQRHIKTHRREGDASSNSHASVTNKTFAAELTCPNLNVQPEKKMKSTIETMHIENSESLPTHEEAFIICDGEKITAKKERLIKQKRCDLTKNPILSLEDISGTHYQQRLYHCHLCQYSYKDKKVVNNHIKVKHLGEAPYNCSECDIPFFNQKGLYKHNIKLHPTRVKKRPLYAKREKAEVLLSCPDCSFTTSLSKGSELAIHSMIHAIPKSELFNCHVCHMDFRTDHSLKSHFGRYHRKGEPYSCDFCSYKTKTNKQLLRHTRRHTKEFIFFCDKCNKGFVSRSHLNRHMIQSTSCGSHVVKKKRYECAYCDFSTSQKMDWRDHEYQHVSTEPRYKCDITDCKYITFRELNLKEHKRRKHNVYVRPWN